LPALIKADHGNMVGLFLLGQESVTFDISQVGAGTRRLRLRRLWVGDEDVLGICVHCCGADGDPEGVFWLFSQSAKPSLRHEARVHSSPAAACRYILPFFLFVIALFSPGNLGPLLSNPWFYFLLFVVSIVFSVIAQQDIVRIFGHGLSGPVLWFEGWTGLLRMYSLVCAVILPVVWFVLFLDASSPLVHKTAYANGLFMGELKTLLIIALGVTGYIRRHLAINDAIANASYVAVSGICSQKASGAPPPTDSSLPPHS
jgi:hypothetical protein